MALLCAAILIGLWGCGGDPPGVGYVNDKPIYTVSMTSAQRESYFTILSKAGTVAALEYGTFGPHTISWYAVKGGGLIAWEGNCVRYVPAGYTDSEIMSAFATLSSESSTMSIETAKEYIPQLAD